MAPQESGAGADVNIYTELNHGAGIRLRARNRQISVIESRLQRKVAIGFIGAMLMTASLNFLGWRNKTAASDESDFVAHTYILMRQFDVTLGDVVDVETGARGFAATGQEQFLEPFTSGQRSLIQDLNSIRQLTAHDSAQSKWLGPLADHINASVALSQEMVAWRRRGEGPKAAGFQRGKNLVDAVRGAIRAQQSDQARILNQRTVTTAAKRRLSSSVMFTSSLVGLSLLALAWIAVNRALEASERARAQIGTLNAELEQRVEQRTAVLQSEITERKRTEAALQETEEKFGLLIEGVKDYAIYMLDPEGRVISWNAGAARIKGYLSEEILGKHFSRFYRAEDIEAGKPARDLQEALSNGRFEEEALRVRKDGSIFWANVVIAPMYDEHGNHRGFSKVARDITERKQTEERLAGQAEELARSRQVLETQTLMLQSVLESMAEGLVATDEQGKFVLWNPAAERMLGMGAANLPSQKWTQHYGLYQADGVTPFPTDQIPLVRAIRGEVSLTEMFVRNPALAEGTWIEVSASPRKDKHGVVCGGVAAFRDTTRQKADEREIRKLNDELEIRVAERTAQLENANQELEAFTYSVSHDLRAPLRHISGFSKILTEDFGATLEPEAKRYLEKISDGVRKMGVLVDELLALAGIGRHELSVRFAGLNSLAVEIISILAPETEGRLVEWKIGDLGSLNCDPVLIGQVFQNLIANALKFTRPCATAVIEIGRMEDAAQPTFFVRDNGVGFDMKYADKLFGVFQRLHRIEDFEGTGIGLATVRRIVQKHAGRTWAEGQLGKGATFYFTLALPAGAEIKTINAKSSAAGVQL
jgi:PAS domain S-box-containing protein